MELGARDCDTNQLLNFGFAMRGLGSILIGRWIIRCAAQMKSEIWMSSIRCVFLFVDMHGCSLIPCF